MPRDIVEARPSNGYRLFVRFEDGVQGEVDLERIIRFEGVFAPLKDHTESARVSVNHELGTVCWPRSIGKSIGKRRVESEIAVKREA